MTELTSAFMVTFHWYLLEGAATTALVMAAPAGKGGFEAMVDIGPAELTILASRAQLKQLRDNISEFLMQPEPEPPVMKRFDEDVRFAPAVADAAFEFNADCPACLRHRPHTLAEHEALLNASKDGPEIPF